MTDITISTADLPEGDYVTLHAEAQAAVEAAQKKVDTQTALLEAAKDSLAVAQAELAAKE